MTASLRKSFADLSKRRARTLFTACTLALAVGSIGFLAVPTLIDREMQDEAARAQLADVIVGFRPLPLTAAQLDAIAALPGVAAVEAQNTVDTRILIGDRRARARVIGVRSFERQTVDVVGVDSGAAPSGREVLSEVQNGNVGVFEGEAGDSVTALVGAGRNGPERVTFRISGIGRSLPWGELVQDDDVVVLYASTATVAGLSGEQGYGRLAFRLREPGAAQAGRTIEALRRYLTTVPGFRGFANLPSVRAPGDWPGKVETEKFAQLLGVITVLALLSALVLISNTMTTLVAEQTGEIGVMRAIGARRRQVALLYVRTALLLGALGTGLGIALGVLIANLLAGYFGTMFWAVDVGAGVDLRILVASVLVGLLAPPLAALPAIRRAVNTDLREALESSGSAVGRVDAADGLLRRATFLPRTAQIGLRNAGRRKRRSLATATIVALAVANLLACMGLAAAATKASRASWGDHLEDVRVWTTGRDLFDARAALAIRSTPGVAEAQPALVNTVDLRGEEAFVWGVRREPLFRYELSEGRWFDAAEERAKEPVAVIERNVADAAGVELGERVTLTTAVGPVQLRIVGVSTNQQEDGYVLFVPLTTLRSLLGVPTNVSTYWIRTTSRDHALIDRTAAGIEDRLGALGYEIASELTYVGERDEVAANRTITTTITILGLLIVAISMVGLANAITTTVLERTREIGILRCIGARARDVRRIFTTEGLVIATVGWLLGIPLGFLLARLLVWLVWKIVEVRIPFTFPLWNVVIALVGTLLLALLVLFLPLRRAVRYRPGDALRYA